MNRVTPIDARMLERFEQGYAARPELNVMSNAVSRTALPDAAFVPAAAAKLRMDFSVLVKTNNITNQKQSGRCWMFSTLNVLRQRVIAKCDLEDFSFSPTYLAFYDKLEKANLFLENILHFADQDLTDRETYTLLGNPLPDGGQWDMAISLIKKYGVVPSWVMPETVHSTGTAKYLPILNRKWLRRLASIRRTRSCFRRIRCRRSRRCWRRSTTPCASSTASLPGAFTLSIPTRMSTTTATGT